jgi:DNA-binding NarL/FixJ family response regulator
MLKILIASDHQPLRETLTRLLSAHPHFSVTDVCADTHAAMSITAYEQPDIVLIDGSTDPLAAIEATKKITGSYATNVIALSRQSDAVFAQHMLSAGALGYITRYSSDIEMITAVEEVAKDNLYCCLEQKHLPVETPAHLSSFRKSLASLKANTRKKIAIAAEVHWHGILKFTN